MISVGRLRILTMIGMLRRTRNQVLLAAGLVGVQEIAIVLVAVSPTVGLNGSLAQLGVYISFGLFFGSMIFRTMDFNPRKKTRNPLLGWLYLHTLYWLPSALNGVILYVAILYILVGNGFLPNWPFLLAFVIIVSWFYDYLILQGMGQEYQNLSGASWAGAAAFAKLARGMFQAKRREGLSPLMKSLGITQTLFNIRGYGPENLDATCSTVVALSDSPSIDFKSLVDLTAALEILPLLDELPPALEKFLRDTKWPGMFKPVPSPQASAHQGLVILLASLTALSTFLTALPDEERKSFFSVAGSFLISDLIYIMAAVGIVIASVTILYAVVYWVPLAYLRKFWPRE